MQRDVMKVAIAGTGVVGGALRAWFDSRGITVAAYDPPRGAADRDVLDAADVVFVCVPTPYTAGIGFDDSFLLDAVKAIPGGKIVVIKSTVLPGTTDLLQARMPQHRFLFNPEFLREASALEDMLRPDRQIVGYTERGETDAELIMSLLPAAPAMVICQASQAEMAKYMANSFLAVKVSFANEFYDLCERMRIDYAGVRDIVAGDGRIGGSHLDVFAGGYRGYGGNCLPKDSMALLDLAETFGSKMRLLVAAAEVNEDLIPVRAESPDRPVRIAARDRDEWAEAAA